MEKSIGIMGIGAIGSNLAALLAVDLRGEHEITILDKDRVEERNIQAGTQYFLPFQIGELKTEALQYRIYKDFSKEIEEVINEKVTQDNARELVRGFDLIIDCFDNFEARKAIVEASVDIDCLHLGFPTK